MNSISETGRPFALLNYETFAFWAYTAGVATTAFGPIAHYIGWTFALASLIYGKLRYNASLSVKLGSGSKRIMIFLVLFLIWSMFAHIPYVDSFYVWGKGASIPLEFLTGLYLAMRLIDTSKKREIFGLAVLAVNLVFCFDVMFRPNFQILGWNGSLDNGNGVALYSLLTMPFFFCYSFWYFEKYNFVKYFICMTSLLLIFFSFSSGGWSAALFQVLIFMYYALMSKKVSIKALGVFLILFGLLITFFFCSYGKGYISSFKREIDQITSINNSEVLTNSRIYTWKAGIILASDNIIAGNGWATFEESFRNNYKYLNEKVQFRGPEMFVQPHNMYISILYAGGIPALLLFLIAFVLSTKKSWSGLRHDVINSGDIPWHLVCFILMVSMAIYGTNGDVFEARRDISVIFWACWGLLIVMPESDQNSDKGDKSEDPALC